MSEFFHNWNETRRARGGEREVDRKCKYPRMNNSTINKGREQPNYNSILMKWNSSSECERIWCEQRKRCAITADFHLFVWWGFISPKIRVHLFFSFLFVCLAFCVYATSPSYIYSDISFFVHKRRRKRSKSYYCCKWNEIILMSLLTE